MKLIPMTDFVLDQTNKYQTPGVSNYLEISRVVLTRIRNYAHFLKQPIKLGMFVPVNGDGEVLKEPAERDYSIAASGILALDKKKYQQAREEILFEGFTYCQRDSNILCVVKDGFHLMLSGRETIEELVGYNLTLTEVAENKFLY